MLKRVNYFFSLLVLITCLIAGYVAFKPHKQYRTVSSIAFYDDRPQIEKITPQSHQSLNFGYWKQIKEGYLNAIAFFTEVYPDHEIYFLARDAEHLYDASQILLKDDLHKKSKFHLINVSRSNIKDPHLSDYLKEAGLSLEQLKKSKKFLLVDTGLSGSLFEPIKELFPASFRSQIQGHLLLSYSNDYPSLRGFFSAVEENKLDPYAARHMFDQLESLPRYFDRSNAFKKKAGKWQAIVESSFDLDGRVSISEANRYREDLFFFLDSLEARGKFHKQRTFWRKFTSLAKEDPSQLWAEISKWGVTDSIARAHTFDAAEVLRKNLSVDINQRALSLDVGDDFLSDQFMGMIYTDLKHVQNEVSIEPYFQEQVQLLVNHQNRSQQIISFIQGSIPSSIDDEDLIFLIDKTWSLLDAEKQLQAAHMIAQKALQMDSFKVLKRLLTSVRLVSKYQRLDYLKTTLGYFKKLKTKGVLSAKEQQQIKGALLAAPQEDYLFYEKVSKYIQKGRFNKAHKKLAKFTNLKNKNCSGLLQRILN